MQQNDVDTDILPSFPRLRQQNLQTLYGAEGSGRSEMDKSRAGGVDAHIQNLVDYINQHPSFVTLSSCSGRIALFDPSASDDQQLPVEPSSVERDDGTIGATASGKGSTGAWLLISHDEVDPAAILPFFSEPDDTEALSTQSSSCSLKFEPMLLHVAACNLKRGQQLLQVVLQAGFRESGLVVTDERVTVAIRTQSLGLTIPLSRQCNSPLRPSSSYLLAVMQEANRRLAVNLERLQKLHRALQDSSLFKDATTSNTPCCSYHVCKSSNITFPNLFLHGHAMVAVMARGDSNNVDLIVFGGYGPGPLQKSPQRSGNVHVLQRVEQVWKAQWQTIDVEWPHAHTSISIQFGNHGRFNVEPIEWQPCQGTAAVALTLTRDTTSIDHDLIVLFGGRKSPAQPLGTLLLFTYNGASSAATGRFYKANDVRGAPPTPRWGHTLTSLNNAVNNGHSTAIALLVGGRDEHSVCHDGLYLLSLVPVDDPANKGSVLYHFVWESLGTMNDAPSVCRFYHASVALDQDRLFLFGGLFTTNALAGVESNNQDYDDWPGLLIELNRSNDSSTASARIDRVDMPPAIHDRFALGACLLSAKSRDESHLLLSGGILLESSRQGQWQENHDTEPNSEVDSVLQCVKLTSRGDVHKLESCPIEYNCNDRIDLGSLVHHSCVLLLPSISQQSNRTEVALVGGGVAGFAFQDCYANSACLLLEQSVVDEDSTSMLHRATTDARRLLDVPSSSSRKQALVETTARTCNVVYVYKQNAKALKTQLEAQFMLDKRYRLTNVVESGILARFGDTVVDDDMSLVMAVPVYPSCIEAIDIASTKNRGNSEHLLAAVYDSNSSWMRLVVGYGRQECLQSSGSYARAQPV